MYKDTKKTNNSHSEKNTGDEIDITDILSGFKSMIRSIGKGLDNLGTMIAQRKLLFLPLVAAGILLGYGAYSITKPYYTSSMTLVLADIRNQFVEDQLDKLSEMISDNNIDAISEGLGISAKEAGSLKEMTFSNLDQERVSEDSILTGSPFKIQLQLYDRSLFSTIAPALTSYLESNPYFASQKLIRQQQIKSMINKLKDEIASLETIKATAATPRGPVNGFVYGEPLDPTNLYRETISMYEQQVELEAELEQLNNIQIVMSFSPQSRPTGPNLINYFLSGGLIAFILGLMTALRLEASRKRKLSY